MVSHGHFVVGGKKITIPSYCVAPGDVISIRAGSQGKKIFENLSERLKEHIPLSWLSFDPGKMEAKVLDKPKNTETFLDLNAVLEFYSR